MTILQRWGLSTLLLSGVAFAAGSGSDVQVTIEPPEDGSVSLAEGQQAWARIYEVVSHPRCANCHVGEDNIPMWSGPSYGKTRPHGMHINAGDDRIGATHLLCMTCHITSKDFDTEPHAAPRHGKTWALAPAEFQWFGKSSAEVCEQLKDPDRNGGRKDHLALAEHLKHDAEVHGPVLWGWNPGGTREPAPYSLQAHVDDMLIWGVAGMPCPEPEETVASESDGKS